MQFHDTASEWYDAYLIDHEPPRWEELIIMVNSHFKKINARNILDELKSINKSGTREEY
jgi:hypothetical protein